MWFTRTVDGFRGWFRVQTPTGVPRGGIVPGDFTVTVVDPANTSTSLPVVTESIKPGLYFFDIPAAFLGGGGIGEYGVLVQVDTSGGGPKVKATFSETLKVNTKGFEDIASSLSAGDIAAIADAVWDELLAAHTVAGSASEFVKRILQLAQPDVEIDTVNMKIRLRDKDTGTLLVEYDVSGIIDTRITDMDA